MINTTVQQINDCSQLLKLLLIIDNSNTEKLINYIQLPALQTHSLTVTHDFTSGTLSHVSKFCKFFASYK